MAQQTKTHHHILAAFMLLTRLPLWRVVRVTDTAFRRATDYWSLVGWLTAGTMVVIYWLSMLIGLPTIVAIILALLSRLILTGAFHEDGLGDFFDGFGAGGSRERILRIMKDSHTGSYGILAFVIYYALAIHSLAALPPNLTLIILGVGDPFCKLVASQLINTTPYARQVEESKIETVYKRMSIPTIIFSFAAGAFPLFLFLPMYYWPAILIPVLIFVALRQLMMRKIGGYTGDCCGATFLLCELGLWLGVLMMSRGQ